jgi:hypothetical protein
MVGWNLTDIGEPTSDSFVRAFPIADVLVETRRALDGSSSVAHDRIIRMEKIQGVLVPVSLERTGRAAVRR